MGDMQERVDPIMHTHGCWYYPARCVPCLHPLCTTWPSPQVDGKVAMEVPLRDVSQAQQNKDDVMMELHADDTAADDRQDVLTEMSFHVPASNEDFVVGGTDTAAKAFLDQVGAGWGRDRGACCVWEMRGGGRSGAWECWECF